MIFGTKGYPLFEKLVRTRLSTGLKQPALKKLAQYSQMDSAGVSKALSIGNNPTLRVSKLNGAEYGWYPGVGDVIHIRDVVVQQYVDIVTMGRMPQLALPVPIHNRAAVDKLIAAI